MPVTKVVEEAKQVEDVKEAEEVKEVEEVEEKNPIKRQAAGGETPSDGADAAGPKSAGETPLGGARDKPPLQNRTEISGGRVRVLRRRS